MCEVLVELCCWRARFVDESRDFGQGQLAEHSPKQTELEVYHI